MVASPFGLLSRCDVLPKLGAVACAFPGTEQKGAVLGLCDPNALVRASKSMTKAVQLLRGSSGEKLCLTSCAVSSAMHSCRLHSLLRLQMVLSRTKRGSRPSANTMLSLPTAVPCGYFCLAALMSPSKGATQRWSISVCSSSARMLGLCSVWDQFPVQCRRCKGSRSEASAGALRGCHWLLAGSSLKAPVGMPCCRCLCRSVSGS